MLIFHFGRPTRPSSTSSRGRPPMRWTSGVSDQRAEPPSGSPYNSRVSYPALLNQRILLYLATDPDGGGPWLHSLDLEQRIPQRIGFGVDRYTSLAASADCRRLVVTLANPSSTMWRLPISDPPIDAS